MTKTRGRPRKIEIPALQELGRNSLSQFKCNVCSRAFERRKSLNTHRSIHNGVKKYSCNFPNCQKVFTQSNQLNNHLYLHSREQPYICNAEGCMARYTHANRICSLHKDLKVVKQLESAEEIRHKFYKNEENLSEAHKNWFQEYLAKRESKLQPPASKRRKVSDTEGLQFIHNDGMKVSVNDETINEDDIMKGSDSDEDNIFEVTENKEDSISKLGENEEVSSEGVGEENIHEDVIVKVCNTEKDIPKNTIKQVEDSTKNLDAAIFQAFFNYLFQRGGDSRALFLQSLAKIGVKICLPHRPS